MLSLSLSVKHRITFCIFPTITNFCFILFIALSIDLSETPGHPRNAIALTDCFLLFLLDMLVMIFYGLVMGNWSELFYGVTDPIIAWLVIASWPVF
jgi:hypothetical protein